jgi:hypothetical protein
MWLTLWVAIFVSSSSEVNLMQLLLATGSGVGFITLLVEME